MPSSSILAAFPILTDWVKKYPLKVVETSIQWPNLLKVLAYFSQTPKPNLYIRELPIEVHTKFVEQNKGILKELLDILIADYVKINKKCFEAHFNLKYDEDLIRARYLDNELSYCYRTGLKDITLLVSEFRVLNWKVQSVIIAEDKVNFLTFPSVKNTIIIWGHDCGVAKLKNI